MDPTSYNLRRVAFKALLRGDFQNAAQAIVIAKETEAREVAYEAKELREKFIAVFCPTDQPKAKE